jgi:hypothetical protein
LYLIFEGRRRDGSLFLTAVHIDAADLHLHDISTRCIVQANPKILSADKSKPF